MFCGESVLSFRQSLDPLVCRFASCRGPSLHLLSISAAFAADAAAGNWDAQPTAGFDAAPTPEADGAEWSATPAGFDAAPAPPTEGFSNQYAAPAAPVRPLLCPPLPGRNMSGNCVHLMWYRCIWLSRFARLVPLLLEYWLSQTPCDNASSHSRTLLNKCVPV